MGVNQSEPYPRTVIHHDENNPKESPILRNSRTLTENGGQLISTFRSQPEANTAAKLIRGSAIKYAKCEFLGEREVLGQGVWGEYHFETYEQGFEKMLALSRSLLNLGMKKGDRIGIYSHNCPFWQITAYGAHLTSIVIVPVYDSLGPGAAEYIIEHAECKAIVVHQNKLQNLIDVLPKLVKLEIIIVIGEIVCDVQHFSGKKFFTSSEIINLGLTLNDNVSDPDPDDLAVIMYTSGSTGKPKGCLLTHRNVIAGGTGLASLGCSITKSDVFCSFLPLAHIYEMGVEYIMVAQGTAIGFSTGNVRNLTSDLAALRPTIITGVPRVWNRIADLMKKKIEELPAHRKLLVKTAFALKAKAIRERKPQSLLLDQIVFSKFISVLGGRVRLIVSGGAPILPEVYEFLSVALTPNIVQGYGLTEVAASAAVQEIPAWTASDTGAVSITSEVKLRAVEGLQYDPRGNPMCGEVLIRGPHVFKGYYKDENLTEQCMVDGEWFATGDIAQITPKGVVQIIDRAKQLVKLSQGEYISITSLNDTYSTAEGVANIYIYADSHHDAPAAVVVPTQQLLDEWKSQGITDPRNEKHGDRMVCSDKLLANLNACAEMHQLRGFERIKVVIIETEDFTIENGLLTPSMKPQWQSLRSKYEAKILDAMTGKE